ncbi:MAG: zinc ribbon domain-containing protein [Opitutales bacterium]|nr:zinc ribbon domain-containing protein [Opitutales bacterium]
MTTYVYETIPSAEGEEPELFEIRQNMSDAPLEKHPETGQPIRRVILGGYGLLKKGESPPPSSCGCGPSGCC